MRKPAFLLLALVALVPFTEISAQAQSVMTHHVRDAIRNGEARLVGHLPADQVMNLDVVLPLSDAAGLDSFLADVNNPASPSFRHYLSVPEFTARFGPSQSDYDSVVSFLAANGFTVTGGSRDGMDVQASGPVSAVEAAFHITIRTYKHPTESRSFYGPDTEPVTSLPFSLWHVSGLDNYSIPKPMLVNRNDYARRKSHQREGRSQTTPPRVRGLRVVPRQRYARRILWQHTGRTE